MLVGITGRAQHGKDTIGRLLVAEYGFTRLGFADQLKILALKVDPIIPRYQEAQLIRLSQFVGLLGWEKAKEHGEVRRFLQELGTQVRDILGEDAWVRALERTWLASGARDTVITDVRFPNEAEWIKRHNGQLWRVTRPGFDNGVDPTHPSEIHVPDLPADAELLNTGTIEELQSTVRQWMTWVMYRALGVREEWGAR